MIRRAVRRVMSAETERQLSVLVIIAYGLATGAVLLAACLADR